MESLPSEIVLEIVSRVPAESVLECKLGCKRWETLIRCRNFTDMHLSHQLNHLHSGELAAKVEPCIIFACRIDEAYRTLVYHGGLVSDRIRVDEKYIFNQNLKRIYHPPMHDEPLTDHLVGSCNGLVCTFQSHQLIMDPIYICNPLTADGPYPRNHMSFLDFESRDDGPTTEEAISLLDDPSVSPTVIPMSGKGETYVHSLDSESNTHQDDGSTASAAVLDTSTTTTGGSKVLIPEGSQEGEVQQASMESLPADIVQEILSRVPAEFVMECKLVSKKWATLIRGSNFAKMHLTHQLKHLHDNIAADVEPCLFFACRIDKGYKTLLFHGGQVSDGISVDGKYIYNQNLKRIYHAPMHDEPLTDHIVGSCNGLVCTFQSHQLIMEP